MNNTLGPRQKRTSAFLASGILIVVVILVIVGLTTANYRFSSNSPGGNDFIPRWLGTRLLLTQGQNPYSEETSLAIQQFIYGRPADVNEDQVLFVYPLYSALLFTPFALIGDYVFARAVWMTTLQVALLAMAFVALRLADWRPALPMLALILLFALTWYHGARPLINGNASILMALFVAAALFAIKEGRDVVGGILLASATIKPQAVILIVPLILLWALSKKRAVLITSTVVSVVSLALLAALVEPGWLLQNLEQVTAYPDYTLAGTPGAIFQEWWPEAGPWPGIVLTVLIVLSLAWQWRTAWNRSVAVLLPVAFFTIAATNLIGITTAVSNYIALFPGLILLLAFLRRDEGRLRDWPTVPILLLLLVGLWTLFWITRSGRAQSPLLFFPLPILLMITMPILARKAYKRDLSSSARESLST